MIPGRVLVGLLLVAAAVIAGSSFASTSGGGTNIATAQPITPGVRVVSGGVGTQPNSASWPRFDEYWRIDLQASDRVTINWSPTNGKWLNFCLIDPTLDDYSFEMRYTAESSKCTLEDDTAAEKRHIVWTAPSAGSWKLRFWTSSCCGSPIQAAYEVTAYVQKFTATSVKAPRLANTKQSIVVRGTVSGVGPAKILVRITGKGGFKTQRVVPVKANGSFELRSRLSKPGTYTVQAVYLGDNGHLPSKAAWRITVA